MALPTRKAQLTTPTAPGMPVAPGGLAAKDPDIEELCAQLRLLIRSRAVVGLQSHEIQDLQRDLLLIVDKIDAADRHLRPRPEDDDDEPTR